MKEVLEEYLDVFVAAFNETTKYISTGFISQGTNFI